MKWTALRVIGMAVTFAAALPATRAGAGAQPIDLAERMPEGTLLYFGWSGCTQAEAAAKDTAIGKTLADPQVRGFFDDLWGAIDGFISTKFAGSEVGTRPYEAGRRLAFDVCRHPGAVAVVDLGLGEEGPVGQIAFLLHLGQRAEGFVADLRTVLETAPLPPAQPVTIAGRPMQQLDLPLPGGVFYGAADGYFILAIGAETVEKLLAPPTPESACLARSERLGIARSRIGGDGGTRAMTLYLDIAGLLERAKMLVPMFVRDQQDQERIWSVLSALGLDGIQSFCWEMHYRRQGCFNGVFIHTAGEPRGLLAMGSTALLTEEELALIPKEPYWATAFSLNPGRIFSRVLSMVETIDASSAQEVAGMIADGEEALGLRLDSDLLDLLGEKFIIYDAPENGGLWFTGTTLIVESSDPQKLQAGIGKIVQAVAKKVDSGRRRPGGAALSVSATTYRDHRIEFANLTGVPMPVAPAWTAHGQRLIVALYPQMVMAAVDRMLDHRSEDSLLANRDFVKGREVLGGIGSTLTYLDTRRAARQLYAVALPFAQVGAAMAQGQGVKIDVASFPTQQALTRHLFGHLATTHHRDDGILYAAYGPLPWGMAGIGESTGATTVLATSILLPSLSRARTQSKRQVSMANLRRIGMSCIIYASEHDGEFPPDLKTLVREGEIMQKHLNAPLDEPGRVSYVYLAGQDEYADMRNVLLHERRDVNNGEGVNVAFVDGHVEFVRPMERFERLLQDTKDALKRIQAE